MERQATMKRSVRTRAAWSCLLVGVIAVTAALVNSHGTQAQSKAKPARPTVVLVHGAFADGSSWSEVVPILQAAGLKVVAVQNPLSSLADDVAAATRAIELQPGPVVLVGHSWGGTVITQAGNHPKVAALVYVAAFAPEVGDSTSSAQKAYPKPGYVSLLQPDSAGFVYLPEDAFVNSFAQDLPPARAKVIAAIQGPIKGSAFDDKVTQAAWHNKPSFYLVTDEDRMIYPALQREFATRMKATTTTLKASHVPFLSKPKETAAVILAAVKKSES